MLRGSKLGAMDFRLSPAQRALKEEVCRWLAQETGASHDTDPVPVPPGYLHHRDLERKMGERGWLAVSWPPEYGGQGRPVLDQFLVEEEMALHGAPASDALGRTIIAPMIMAFGSEEQKRRHLPAMARGEEVWCLGYTEPEAGSDLASAQTRAEAHGDVYRIYGRKVYTSGAEDADYCLLVARTDPDAPKHRGISLLLVPMRVPGVTVRPLYNLLGLHWFNEVIFDGVEVPKQACLGEENRGWQILTSALGVERITVYRVFLHWRLFRGLLRWVRGRDLGPRRALVRQRLADLAIGFEIARLLLYRAVDSYARGDDFRAKAAMVKLFNSELAQRLYQVAVGLLGPYGALREGSPWAVWSGAVAHGYLSAVQETIGAGTSEVQRDLIALRGLGLPRG